MISIFKAVKIVILSAVLLFNIAFAEIKEFPLPESSKEIQSIGAADTNREQTNYLIRQFQERIRENEDEIRYLINEKDWLQNRIYHLEDLNQPVPWEMRNSISIKDKKIRAAFRENGRLNELLQNDRYKNHGEYQGNNINNNFHSDDYSSSYHYGSCSEALKQKVSKQIRDAGLDDWIHFTSNAKDFCKDGNCCVLNNVLPILYSSGSARLANEYKLFLKKLAGIIKTYNIRIRIDGFADINNINTKKYPSNFELGAARAANVVHELVKNGVSPSLFRIATTGKYRPDGKPMSDKKSLERRSEIEIVFM
ncbi:MAG: OmpA family protein [Desulfamplus sp.]|nr:OmpA family protein [Desulfamplus sp.]